MRKLVAGRYCLSDMVGRLPTAAHTQDPFSLAEFITREDLEGTGIQLLTAIEEFRKQTQAQEFHQRTQAQRLEQRRRIVLHHLLATTTRGFHVLLTRESARPSGSGSGAGTSSNLFNRFL